MCCLLAPCAIVGVPLGATLASVAISVPVAVLVGETLTRRSAEVQRADAERQMAIDALAQANVTDDLTGLGNRRQANLMLDGLEHGDALAISTSTTSSSSMTRSATTTATRFWAVSASSSANICVDTTPLDTVARSSSW